MAGLAASSTACAQREPALSVRRTRPIRGGFTISRGAKQEAAVVVAAISDGTNPAGRMRSLRTLRYSVEGTGAARRTARKGWRRLNPPSSPRLFRRGGAKRARLRSGPERNGGPERRRARGGGGASTLLTAFRFLGSPRRWAPAREAANIQ